MALQLNSESQQVDQFISYVKFLKDTVPYIDKSEYFNFITNIDWTIIEDYDNIPEISAFATGMRIAGGGELAYNIDDEEMLLELLEMLKDQAHEAKDRVDAEDEQ